MYIALFTTFDGIHVDTMDTQEDVRELMEEYPDINWLDPKDFEWERAHNGFIIEGTVVTSRVFASDEN